MSLLPILRLCGKTNRQRLFASRNIPKSSTIFKLRGPHTEDQFGKFLTPSLSPNCTVHALEVVAACDIEPGMQLSVMSPDVVSK